VDGATFLGEFEHLAAAPGGIDQLRRLVLDLAVSGRLLPQRAADAPIGPVLEEVGDNTSWKDPERPSKRKLDPKVEGMAGVRAVPKGWAECRMEDFVQLVNGRAYKRPEMLSEGIPIIRIQNLNGGQDWFYSDLKLPAKQYCDNGDLLFAWSASFGPYIWWGERAIYHYHIWKLNLSSAVTKRFMYYTLLHITDEVRGQSHGLAMLHMTKAKMERWPVLLPPVEEQKRIVAKVDELMALCDELEEKQKKKRAARIQLNKACLDNLLDARDPDDFAASWQRVSNEFETVCGIPEAMPQLKALILNLAVRGRLVRSLATDVPALSLVTGADGAVEPRGRRAKRRNESERSIVSRPYGLPDGWEWARFDNVAEIQSNLVSPAKHGDQPHIAPNHIEKGTGRLLEYRTVREDKVTSNKHQFFPGQILYSKIRPNLSKAVVVNFGGLCSADMYPVQSRINARYLHLFILSPVFLDAVVKDANRLAMPKVNQEQLNAVPIAVPPLDEQGRIVEKVEKLTSLCDQLQTALARKSAAGAELVNAAVHDQLVS